MHKKGMILKCITGIVYPNGYKIQLTNKKFIDTWEYDSENGSGLISHTDLFDFLDVNGNYTIDILNREHEQELFEIMDRNNMLISRYPFNTGALHIENQKLTGHVSTENSSKWYEINNGSITINTKIFKILFDNQKEISSITQIDSNYCNCLNPEIKKVSYSINRSDLTFDYCIKCKKERKYCNDNIPF